jgi:hypothetical protein
MSDVAPHGPPVPDGEDLFRLITTPDWWVAEQNRPSSAAFTAVPFSVNIASLTTLEETLRQLSDDLGHPDGGVVAFLCGTARGLGFDTRHEPDPLFPDNTAHAHVYYSGGTSSRKKNARKLADACRTIHPPSF